LWPVVAGRTASTLMFLVVAVAWPAARPPRGVAWKGTTPLLLVATGALDASANALFLVATQHGMLTVVAVLGALYPASTLILARLVLGERLAGWQRVGVAVALTAVVLVSAG
jgi:drug/metabolite transporter (DMT)-like permease